MNPTGELYQPSEGIWAGAITQCGYYPDKAHTNQDAMIVEHRCYRHAGQHLFSVLDGHGPTGHQVAQFMQRRLPGAILGCSKTKKCRATVLRNAYTQINSLVRNDQAIDDSLSGTTCVTAWLHDRIVHIANTGDSRAVLGTTNIDGKVPPPSRNHAVII